MLETLFPFLDLLLSVCYSSQSILVMCSYQYLTYRHILLVILVIDYGFPICS